MDAQDIIKIIVIPVLVPVVTTVLAVAGVVFQDWRAHRGRVGRRKVALEDSRALVGFVTEWWASAQSLGQSSEALQEGAASASAWLEKASTLVSATELPLPEDDRPLMIRRVFLLYPFHDTAGKVIRASFYLCAGLTATTLGQSVSQQLSGEPELQGWALLDLVVGVVVAALGLALRFLAVAVEGNAVAAISRGEPGRGFSRTVLLIYAFHRTSARVVRVLFYVSVLGIGLFVWRFTTDLLLYGWPLWVLPMKVIDTLVYVAGAIGLRAWAAALERTPTQRASAQAVAPASAVLNPPEQQQNAPARTQTA